MPKSMTYEQAARFFKRLGPRLAKEIAKAEMQNLRDAKRIAVKLSSGGVKAATLAKWGHPFSRHYTGSRNLDPAIANRQTGLFRSSWIPMPVSSNLTSGKLEARLINTAPEARFFDPKQYPKGTKRMKSRAGLVQRLIDLNAPGREKLLERALLRALNMP